jgi:hypothetical protein
MIGLTRISRICTDVRTLWVGFIYGDFYLKNLVPVVGMVTEICPTLVTVDCVMENHELVDERFVLS